MMITAKYVMALLLSADVAIESVEEQFTISRLMIVLDMFFLTSSILAIVIAVCVLRARIRQIQKSNAAGLDDVMSNDLNQTDGQAANGSATGFVSVKKKEQSQGKKNNSTQVLPINGSDADRRAAADKAWE